jgi:periplasmic protein TonB
LVGFGFGVWAGAQKPKPPEVADLKKDNTEKPADKPAEKPAEKLATAPTLEPVQKVEDSKPVTPDPNTKPPEPMTPLPPPKPKDTGTTPKDPTPVIAVKAVSFKEVVPILRTYCHDCHGAAGKPKGGVDLTSIAKMLKSKDMPLIPGKPSESAIYTSVRDGRMPSEGKKGPNEKELKLLHDWIASGAKERRRPIRVRGRQEQKLKLTTPPPSG